MSVWQLVNLASHLATIVAVAGTTYYWRRRTIMVKAAFYAGVAEGRALQRLQDRAGEDAAWEDGDGSRSTKSPRSTGRP